MTSAINAKARTDMFKFVTKSRSKIQNLTRLVLMEIGYRLVGRSPVGNPTSWKSGYWPKGYLPGHFINNWQVGIDTKPVGVIAAIDPTGSGSLERLQKLGRWPAGHVYYFVNNLPYAMALENGWSGQAPRGIVKLLQLEFPAIVKEAEAKSNGVSA